MAQARAQGLTTIGRRRPRAGGCGAALSASAYRPSGTDAADSGGARQDGSHRGHQASQVPKIPAPFPCPNQAPFCPQATPPHSPANLPSRRPSGAWDHGRAAGDLARCPRQVTLEAKLCLHLSPVCPARNSRTPERPVPGSGSTKAPFPRRVCGELGPRDSPSAGRQGSRRLRHRQQGRGDLSGQTWGTAGESLCAGDLGKSRGEHSGGHLGGKPAGDNLREDTCWGEGT